MAWHNATRSSSRGLRKEMLLPRCGRLKSTPRPRRKCDPIKNRRDGRQWRRRRQPLFESCRGVCYEQDATAATERDRSRRSPQRRTERSRHAQPGWENRHGQILNPAVVYRQLFNRRRPAAGSRQLPRPCLTEPPLGTNSRRSDCP